MAILDWIEIYATIIIIIIAISLFAIIMNNNYSAKHRADICGKGNYKLFKAYFFKCELKLVGRGNDGWISRKTDSRCRVGTIIFEGKGMIINNPYDWLRILFFMFKMRRDHIKRDNKHDYDWNKGE